MAEYWKSTPKYFCKQCKIYIRDTPFERSQHEASPKHQGSLKRFLRDLHRDNERQERDSQRAKNEVERLKQAVAGGASSKDSGGVASSSSAAAAAPAPWKKTTSAGSAAAAPSRPVSVEERKRQIAQLAEMGVAIPDEYRGELALAGEWQTLSEKVIETGADGEGGTARAAAAMGVRKRKREPGHGDGGEDDERDDEYEGQKDTERFVSKGWGSRMRLYPGVQDDGGADLDALLASTRDMKKVKPLDVGAEAEYTVEDSTTAVSAELPVKEASPDSRPVDAKLLEEPAGEEQTPGIVFKKRKPKIIRK